MRIIAFLLQVLVFSAISRYNSKHYFLVGLLSVNLHTLITMTQFYWLMSQSRLLTDFLRICLFHCWAIGPLVFQNQINLIYVASNSQSQCLNGLYSLCSDRHPLVPRKNLPCWEKKPFNCGEIRRWKCLHVSMSLLTNIMYCIYLHLFVSWHTTGFVRVSEKAAFVEWVAVRVGTLVGREQTPAGSRKPPCLAES